MSSNINLLENQFSDKQNCSSTLLNKCNNTFYNYLVSMNPNVLSLKDNIPKCSICLGFLVKPVKPNS